MNSAPSGRCWPAAWPRSRSTGFLIAVPELNIVGAPVGTLACYVVICIVNYIFLCRTLHERLHIGCCLARPLLSTLIMAVVAWGVYTGLSAVMGGDLGWKRTALAMLVSMACAVVTYLIAVGENARDHACRSAAYPEG